MRTWMWLLCALALATASGCSDDDDDQSADDDNDDDNDSADDDDDDDDNDNDNDDNNDDDTTPWGGVTVLEGTASTDEEAPQYACIAYAAFYAPMESYPWGDAFAQAGDCVYYIRDNMVDVPTYLSGGAVTVSDTAAGDMVFTCEDSPWGCMYSTDTDFEDIDDLFAAGQTIHAAVAGDETIFAQNLAESAPDPVEITAPADFDTLDEMPQENFRIAWVPATSDGVTVALTAAAGYVESSVVCTVPDAQGEVVVPGNLLQMMFIDPFYYLFWVGRANVAFDGGHGAVALSIETARQRMISYAAE